MIKGKILNRFGGEYGTYVTGLGISEYMVFVGTKLIKVFMNINDVLIFAPGDAVAVEMAELARERGPYEELLSGSRYLCDSNGIRIINSDTPQGINTQG